VLVILIGVIGWQFEWWLKEKNVDRQTNLDNRRMGTQTAWHDEAIELFNEADILDPAPQADNLRRQACQLVARLTDPYKDDIIVEMELLHC
jgi:hypothetical protein